MVGTKIGTDQDDLYTRVKTLVEKGDIDGALEIFEGIEGRSQKIDFLSRFARDLALALARAPDFSINHARRHAGTLASVLARALDLDFALARAFDLDFALARILDRARRFGLARTFEPLKRMAQFLIEGIGLVGGKAIEERAKELNLSEPTITINSSEQLTPRTLLGQVAPYLQAISDLQRTISQMKGENFVEPHITYISQNSPIGVELSGGGEAINVVRETVVPWRRKHAKRMAELEQELKEAEIAQKEAEILDLRARTAQTRVETKKSQSDEELERIRLENERLRLEIEERRIKIEHDRLELEQAKIEMAIAIIDQLAVQMSESQRLAYINQLLRPLNLLVESPLEIEAGSAE